MPVDTAGIINKDIEINGSNYPFTGDIEYLIKDHYIVNKAIRKRIVEASRQLDTVVNNAMTKISNSNDEVRRLTSEYETLTTTTKNEYLAQYTRQLQAKETAINEKLNSLETKKDELVATYQRELKSKETKINNALRNIETVKNSVEATNNRVNTAVSTIHTKLSTSNLQNSFNNYLTTKNYATTTFINEEIKKLNTKIDTKMEKVLLYKATIEELLS